MAAVSAGAGPARTKGYRLPPIASWLPGVIGVAAMLGLWQLIGVTLFHKTGTIPPPTRIVSHMVKDGWHFYWPNIHTTLREAAWGWLWGNAIAIVLGVAFVQLPLLEKVLMQVCVAAYCLPIIAIGPVLAILYSGDAPKVILAALSVFFATLVGMVLGLRSADKASLDVVRAYGGGSWSQLWRVRLRASLPSLFAGLRIAAPAAVLGAIIGEYVSTGDRGLGFAMTASQQRLDIPRTWGIAVAATAVSGVGYALTALVARLLTPWAPRSKR
jgi:ABC-type nitrate/sulfonate/bicarbonate transport system permease component